MGADQVYSAAAAGVGFSAGPCPSLSPDSPSVAAPDTSGSSCCCFASLSSTAVFTSPASSAMFVPPPLSALRASTYNVLITLDQTAVSCCAPTQQRQQQQRRAVGVVKSSGEAHKYRGSSVETLLSSSPPARTAETL
ncbi:hypothetical protein INR49_024832 [Caranx melampygus]|nr:hypothetical protein INR49_024832 [Caranx melampygus]